MVVNLVIIAVLYLFTNLFACNSSNRISNPMVQLAVSQPERSIIKTGAEQTGLYLDFIRGKKVGMVVNHTSMIGNVHLVDSLLSLGIRIERIFAPEHGFRGDASDGENISDQKDAKTGIPILSVYGERRKPGPDDLNGLDYIIFDIQDVGTRFYTYISTMSYFLEACAENKLPMLVLDRPNPNGHYVDGPVLEKSHSSFVGLHEVPVVHGMTVGEYALMVNGEGWLANGTRCSLKVIPCVNYDHKTMYELPVKPSPNLPNMRAVYLYPSICFFEGTVVSIGRGTNKQFQVLGAPGFPMGDFSFTPRPMAGSINPPQNGIECRGYDLTSIAVADLQKKSKLDLSYLLSFYRDYPDKSAFFLKSLYIDKLAGSTNLRGQIVDGLSMAQIRESWQPGLTKFKGIRKKYLLYPDFE